MEVGDPTYHVNVIKLICGQAAGLPHLPGVPHLHVNRPQVHKQIQFTSHLSVTCLGTE